MGKKNEGEEKQRQAERRFCPATELRAVTNADDDSFYFEGYAAVFDSLSQDLGGFREKIKPGAFDESLKRKDDVRALWNHDPNFVLGRTKAGTLKLEEDKHGLMVRIYPPETQWARDLHASVRRGDVSQMSFGFFVNENGDEWKETAKGIIRTLHSVSLFDVSPVTFPAYPMTAVQARSLIDAVRGNGRIKKAPAIDWDMLRSTADLLRRADITVAEGTIDTYRSMLEEAMALIPTITDPKAQESHSNGDGNPVGDPNADPEPKGMNALDIIIASANIDVE